MKYILVIGDGMADDPVPELGGKTPLEYRLAFSKTQQNFTVTDSENVK